MNDQSVFMCSQVKTLASTLRTCTGYVLSIVPCRAVLSYFSTPVLLSAKTMNCVLVHVFSMCRLDEYMYDISGHFDLALSRPLFSSIPVLLSECSLCHLLYIGLLLQQ